MLFLSYTFSALFNNPGVWRNNSGKAGVEWVASDTTLALVLRIAK